MRGLSRKEFRDRESFWDMIASALASSRLSCGHASTSARAGIQQLIDVVVHYPVHPGSVLLRAMDALLQIEGLLDHELVIPRAIEAELGCPTVQLAHGEVEANVRGSAAHTLPETAALILPPPHRVIESL
eukprot:scaffold418_cov386-Prasinococcus_capsulatus_cf.AAC.7